MQYIVQPGDTLSSIARRFNVTVESLLAANPQIRDPNFLLVGQIIIIIIVTPPSPGVCPRLSLGSTGPAVRDLQTRLRARGFDPGAIDGNFDLRTQAAVVAFQRSVFIPATGVVDVATWTALGVNCGIVPPPPPPPPPTPGLCPRLSRGSTGAAVRDLQTRLRARGFDPGAIDGFFGPRTENGVMAFQRSVGLPATGVVDIPTWTALGVNCGVVPPPPPPPPPPTPGVCPRLSRGSTGAAVRDLQTRLRARGFDPGAIDGIFGPRTEAALIAFQRSVGLPATGVADVPTWTALGVNCGVVPPPPPPPPPTPGGRYVVQPGDTLSSIARRFNTTVQAILAVNPQITNPNLIFPGQVITIPG